MSGGCLAGPVCSFAVSVTMAECQLPWTMVCTPVCESVAASCAVNLLAVL